MAQEEVQGGAHAPDGGAAASGPDKQPWQEPKLTFVEPTLRRLGTVQVVTGADEGFFTSFNPSLG
jgi:hypothetical protein